MDDPVICDVCYKVVQGRAVVIQFEKPDLDNKRDYRLCGDCADKILVKADEVTS